MLLLFLCKNFEDPGISSLLNSIINTNHRVFSRSPGQTLLQKLFLKVSFFKTFFNRNFYPSATISHFPYSLAFSTLCFLRTIYTFLDATFEWDYTVSMFLGRVHLTWRNVSHVTKYMFSSFLRVKQKCACNLSPMNPLVWFRIVLWQLILLVNLTHMGRGTSTEELLS